MAAGSRCRRTEYLLSRACSQSRVHFVAFSVLSVAQSLARGGDRLWFRVRAEVGCEQSAQRS